MRIYTVLYWDQDPYTREWAMGVKDTPAPVDQVKAANYLVEEVGLGNIEGVGRFAEVLAILPGRFSSNMTILQKKPWAT